MEERYANIKRYALRYSDFDCNDELKLSSLLALAQESAGLSADELGFGYADIKPLDLGFIIVHTYCEICRMPVLGDVLTVETWPLPPRHGIFERDYRVTDARGEVCAVLSTRWLLVDLKTFSMTRPERLGEVHARCPYRDEHTVVPKTWKIPRLTAGRAVRREIVAGSHMDHYMHANNTRYADFFLDCFSTEELSSRRVRAFRISYLKQVKEGEEIVLFREDLEGCSVLEARVGGEVCTQFCIEFEEKNL